jgi:hypothetical protein
MCKTGLGLSIDMAADGGVRYFRLTNVCGPGSPDLT